MSKDSKVLKWQLEQCGEHTYLLKTEAGDILGGLSLQPESEAQVVAQINAATELLDAAAWALDVIEMYDGRLVELGDPKDLVLSPTHIAGKMCVRAVIARARGEAA
jgi:hypothetical protein